MSGELYKQQIDSILPGKSKLPTMEVLYALKSEVEKIIALSDVSENAKIMLLGQIELTKYNVLLRELAYKKGNEEIKLLTKLLENLGDLTVQLARLSRENEINTKIKYCTDAAIFYQYVITTIKEKIDPDSKNPTYIKNLDNLYLILSNIKHIIISSISVIKREADVEPISEEVLLNRTKAEIDVHKAILDNLRAHTATKVEEIEKYRIESQRAEDAEVKRELQSLYISEAKKLFEHIAEILKTDVLARLYREAESEIGPPPCNYTVIGLGSLALNQATPYSDLEFAILTENEDYKSSVNPRIREYFKNLSHLVNFKVISLGETVHPSSKFKIKLVTEDPAQDATDPDSEYEYGIDLSHLIHKGVSFDLGGKTPLGRIEGDKPYELIKTIEWMIRYVKNEGEKASHIDKNLPYILENVCYVYGDRNLIEEYKVQVMDFLHAEATGTVDTEKIKQKLSTEAAIAMLSEVSDVNEVFPEAVSDMQVNSTGAYNDIRLNCEVRALKILREGIIEINYMKASTQTMELKIKGDLERLSPLTGEQGKLFNVKQEIYRLPDRLLYNLGLHYGIQGTSSWDTVNQLVAKGIVSTEAALKLNNVVTFSTILRLKTYLNNQGQVEDLSLFPVQVESDSITQEAAKVFHLTLDDLEENGGLFRYFYTALPFHQKLEEFCEKYELLNFSLRKCFFIDNIFYDDTAMNKGLIHYRLAQYKEARANLESSLATVKNTSILSVRNILGNIYVDFSEGEKAIEQWALGLKLIKQIYPDVLHLDIPIFLNNLGVSYNSLGEYDKAAKCFMDSLTELQKLFPNEPHEDIAMCYNNLGNMHYKMGDSDNAIYFYNEALKMLKHLYKSGLHIDVSHSFNNLGNAYCEKGEYEKAVLYYCKSLDTIKQIYHDECHPDIAGLLSNVGMAYQYEGVYDKAEEYYSKSLAILQQIFKTEPHADIAMCYNNLGIAYRAQGDLKKALSFYNKSLEIKQLLYKGKPHVDIATSLSNIGLVYQDCDNSDQAIEFHNKSLAMLQQIYSTQHHPDIAGCLEHLGMAYQAKGKYDEAIDFYVQAITMLKDIYHSDLHRDIAGVLNNLGMSYYSKAQYDKAIKCYTQALEIQRSVYKAAYHIDIATSLNNLGNAYYIEHKYIDALSFHHQSLEIKQLIYKNQPHRDIATSLNNLGGVYQANRDYANAIKYYSMAIEMQQTLYEGEPHPSIAASLNNLGSLVHVQGDYIRAIQYSSQALHMISNFEGHIYQPVIQKGFLKIAKTFSANYCFNQQSIVRKMYADAIQGLDFTDYNMHYSRALRLSQHKALELDDIIDAHRLALIFMNQEREDIKEIELKIYNNLAILLESTPSSVELWITLNHGNVNKALLLLDKMTAGIGDEPLIQGLTSFIQAIVMGNAEITLKLIEIGADINKQNNVGATPLYCSLGFYGQEINMDIVRLLLEHNAAPNISMNDGDTPMHMAHYRANTDAIKLLLTYDANINAQNHEGKTPLHCLLEKEDISVENKIKIIEGFLPKYDLSLQNFEGKTAVDYAGEYCPETLSILLSNDEHEVSGQHLVADIVIESNAAQYESDVNSLGES